MRSNRRLLKEFSEQVRSNEGLLDEFASELAKNERIFTPRAAGEVASNLEKCIARGEQMLGDRGARTKPDNSQWLAWRNMSQIYLQRAGEPAAAHANQFNAMITRVGFDDLARGLEILRAVLSLARDSLAEAGGHEQVAEPRRSRMRDIDLAPHFLHVLAECSRARSGITMVSVPSMAEDLPGDPDQRQLERVARLLADRGLIRVAGLAPMTVAIESAGYVWDETHYPDTPAEEDADVSSEIPAVFVVHGHDDATRNEIVAFLRRQRSFETIVLQEQPNRGSSTIIEKFERHAGRSRYAIIIATPDDVGCTAAALEGWDPLLATRLKANKATALEEIELTQPPVRPRARQNVVLEWGYFAGRLGRDRVTIVKVGDLEMPSDLGGVLEIREDLELRLLRELHAAGYEVDLG